MKLVGKMDTEKLIRVRELIEEFGKLHVEIMNEIQKFTGKLNYSLEDSLEPYYPWRKFLFELPIPSGKGFEYLVVKKDGEIALMTVKEMFSEILPEEGREKR